MSLKLTESAKVSESSFDYLLGELLSSKDPLSLVMPRLERIGYDVGYRLVESIVEKHKFNSREPVDLVKFICKEFWEELFGKKMDKLQANNKGVFVLSDNKFRWLDRYANDDVSSKHMAAKMLHFPCGILRGAMANLGLSVIVNADFTTLPGCTFNIRVLSNVGSK